MVFTESPKSDATASGFKSSGKLSKSLNVGGSEILSPTMAGNVSIVTAFDHDFDGRRYFCLNCFVVLDFLFIGPGIGRMKPPKIDDWFRDFVAIKVGIHTRVYSVGKISDFKGSITL